MIAFTIYLILVWYGAGLWRRSARGIAFVAAAFAVLVLIAFLHVKLRGWTNGAVYLPLLQGLLYPYAVVVLASGAAIVALPRREHARTCRACAYALRGLGEGSVRCPECGSLNVAPRRHAPGTPGSKTLLTYGFGGSRPAR